jgi:hypothetical protein
MAAVLAAVFLVEPSLCWSCSINEYSDLRADPGRCLWLRIWEAPFGVELQVAEVGRILPGGETFPEPEARLLPAWSQVRAAWPGRPTACDEALRRNLGWMENAFGWPLVCLRTAYVVNFRTASLPESVQGGLVIQKYRFPRPRSAFPARTLAVLPLQIIPVGLGLDALLYAAALAALRFGVRWARARFRRRPGCCPQCGYDLRASQVRCPECGRSIDAPVPNSETPTADLAASDVERDSLTPGGRST